MSFFGPGPTLLSPRSQSAYLAVLEIAGDLGFTMTRTKVAKLLYLADLRQAEFGQSAVTDIEWKWLDHGPYDYALLHTEQELASRGVIRSERTVYVTVTGTELKLVDDNYVRPTPEELARIQSVVEEFGKLSATTIKDLSYQSAPMIEAQKHARGIVLDMSLARSKPNVAKIAARYRNFLRSLPPEDHDAGAAQHDLVDVVASTQTTRKRATAALLG